MKLDYKLSRIIVLGIAVIFIILGIGQAKFGWKVDQNVSSVLLVAAAIVFFVGRKPANTQKNEEKDTEEIIENSSMNNDEKPLDVIEAKENNKE